jgi:hypothetical protein
VYIKLWDFSLERKPILLLKYMCFYIFNFLQEDLWNCQNEVCMFVGVKEEHKFEECSNHLDTSDRLDVVLNK